MKAKVSSTREFVRGVAGRADYVCIISKGKELLEDAIAHTSVVGVYQGAWITCFDTDWDSSAIALALKPSRRLLLIGEDGDVAAYLGEGKTSPEKLSPEPSAIRRAATIDGYVFVCGMNREVYKRVDEQTWTDISAPKPTGDDATGFEAIDGFSGKEIYAAGWGGELWQFDGKKWIDRGAPTNVILTCLCCAPDGVVYVGGQRGVLLKGRRAAWEAVPIGDDFLEDLWDLCWFRDRLYVATMTGLYTLEGNELVEVPFGKSGPDTCYSLTTADGVLWSIGRDDVASFDGKRWTTYD